ncbi:hypothetical protein EJ04DRAFT_568248 [Polyplosphaeria fusca]|uniref:Uncharacterized protein n=1 Tax=Polyplosphaeria fusca TaxID=682080 RepID=A0A9P4QM69_9PLEO|nr:hypothetical protein EJ04DRAFT_568248 [Polyplosphaeria fusca]
MFHERSRATSIVTVDSTTFELTALPTPGEKKAPIESVKGLSDSSDESTKSLTGRDGPAETWIPGFWNRFPWVGFAGMCLVLVGMGCTIAVLCISNDKQVDKWPISGRTVTPNVLVNLCNQIANLGLLTLVGQGLAISWWRKAMRGGTIEELHRNHAYGTSLMSVAMGLKHFNWVALAALMTKFAIIDSTLFQKSTRMVIEAVNPIETNIPLRAFINPTWPDHVGGYEGPDLNISVIDGSMANIIDAFNTKIGNGKVHDVVQSIQGCPPGQSCDAIVEALGFSYDCTSSVENVDYGAWVQDGSDPPLDDSGDPKSDRMWLVEFITNYGTEDKPDSFATITLNMEYINSSYVSGQYNCPGTLTRRTCTITPATVKYPLTVLMATPEAPMNATHLAFSKNNIYPFSYDLRTDQIDTLEVVKTNNLYEMKDFTSTTVGGITFVLNNLFGSEATLQWNNSIESDDDKFIGGWDLNVKGSRAQSQFWIEPDDYEDNDYTKIPRYCDYRLDLTDAGFADPFISLVREMNNFAFVSALYISGAPFERNITERVRDKENYPRQNVSSTVYGYVEVYDTNFYFMAGGIIATVVTILLVLPVYWGFWKLGRKVSLAPFEIANAFNAPVFAGAHAKNGALEDLLSEVGQRRVQYGHLVDGNGSGQLAIAEPVNVRRPERTLAAEELSGRVAVSAALGGALGGVIATQGKQ